MKGSEWKGAAVGGGAGLPGGAGHSRGGPLAERGPFLWGGRIWGRVVFCWPAFICRALSDGPYGPCRAVAARDWAGRASLAALGVSGFFALEEGLTLFARAVNGNGGYVGAEPLLSATVCVISGAGLLLSRVRKA